MRRQAHGYSASEQSYSDACAATERRLPERLPVVWTVSLLAVDLLAVLATAYAIGIPPNDGPATGLIVCGAFALCGVYQRSYAVGWRDEAYHVLVASVLALLPLWAVLHLIAGLPSSLPIAEVLIAGATMALLHGAFHFARHGAAGVYAGAAYVSPQAQWRSKSASFRVWKNFFDVLLAAIGLLVLSPVMLAAAACILIESGLPIFFRQERVGRSGSRFEIFKFRTMRHEAGLDWARPGDNRITRVGSLLRRTSVDELPQLFNVLRGDMSLVGPRPEMESFAQKFSRTIPRYDERHIVEPGLTGWAQINFKRNLDPSDMPGVLPYDLFYVEHASPVLDAIIVSKTVGNFSSIVQFSAQSGAHGILYDGLFSFGLRMLNIVAALAVGVLTARLLGPSGKGLYAMPVVQAGLVSSVFAGLSSATSYYLLNGGGRRVLRPMAIATAVLVAGCAVAVLPIALLGRAWWAAPAAIASLPAVALANVVTGYVIGIKRVRYASSVVLVTTLATFTITAIGLFLVARSPFIAIAAWIISTTIVAIVATALVLAHARSLAPGKRVELGSYMRMALKVGATSLVSLLNYRGDLYVVAIMLPASDLGLYTIATSAPQSLLLPTQVASLVTSPHIGALDRDAAARLAARCVRNNLLMAATVCVAVFALAPFIIRLFYGAPFLPLVPALRILLIGVVALSLGGPISSYYTLKLAKPEIPLVLAGISAAICISGSIALIPRLGIAGAALASSAAYIVGQGLGLQYFARRTGITFRAMIPTADDLYVYLNFARRVYRDGARLLMPGHSMGK